MSDTEYVSVSDDVLDAVSNGWYHAPHDVLGPHQGHGCVTIRAIRRLADEVYIETKNGRTPAVHEANGIWRAVLEGEEVPDYRVVAVYGGVEDRSDDPYRFMPTVGEMDAYLFSEGRHEQLWELLGSHVHTYESELGDTTGTSFAVWAPNAKAVRVVGDFNGWDGSLSAMRTLGASGIWEIFIPEAYEGARYKYEIQYEDLSWHQKADPMARQCEVPPSTASIVTASHYEWGDEDWMANRSASDPHSGPISIYEMHLGSWRPGLDYRSLAEQLIGHVKYAGFTHVEFMPIAEHPFTPSWGYQVTGYYAPTSRFGSPDDLRYLIDELHKAGIGVIIDWVPAHFPKDEWALARFDGTALYEDPNPQRGEHPDWSTLIFNFGRREVRNFLVANVLYWAKEFHIDGVRVDAVASMLYLDYSREDGEWSPNVYGGRENLEAISFLQEATATAYRVAPGIIMMAEESTSWPGVTGMTDNGGLGFGLKWNMGWMNDTLHYLEEKPINRKWHHSEITFSLVYAFSEQYLLPLSHDEVVHGKGSLYQKMPGDDWQKLAGVRQLFAYQWAHPGKKLLFMGQEFAQIEEWNESRGLDWWLKDDPSHDGILSLVKNLNEIYLAHPALWEKDFSGEGFEWIDLDDSDHNIISFLRWNADRTDVIAVVCNFSGIPFHDYRVGLPIEGQWDEIVNTDALEYGGSGVGNLGAVYAEAMPWNNRPYSAPMQLPPFGVVYFCPADAATASVPIEAEVETSPSYPEHAPIPAVALAAAKESATSGTESVAVADYPEHAPVPPIAAAIVNEVDAATGEACCADGEPCECCADDTACECCADDTCDCTNTCQCDCTPVAYPEHAPVPPAAAAIVNEVDAATDEACCADGEPCECCADDTACECCADDTCDCTNTCQCDCTPVTYPEHAPLPAVAALVDDRDEEACADSTCPCTPECTCGCENDADYPEHAPIPAVALAAVKESAASDTGTESVAIADYPEHAPLPAVAAVAIHAPSPASAVDCAESSDYAESPDSAPSAESPVDETDPVVALVSDLVVDPADAALRMPGVLPPEPAEREPIGEYTIVEYDYTELASLSLPEPVTDDPVHLGAYVLPRTWDDDDVADSQPHSAQSAPSADTADSAEAAVNAAESAPSAPTPDAVALARSDEMPPEPAEVEEDNPLISASASAAAAFLDAPITPVMKLDERKPPTSDA